MASVLRFQSFDPYRSNREGNQQRLSITMEGSPPTDTLLATSRDGLDAHLERNGACTVEGLGALEVVHLFRG
jgi:hypothetical protein